MNEESFIESFVGEFKRAMEDVEEAKPMTATEVRRRLRVDNIADVARLLDRQCLSRKALSIVVPRTGHCDLCEEMFNDRDAGWSRMKIAGIEILMGEDKFLIHYDIGHSCLRGMVHSDLEALRAEILRCLNGHGIS